MGPGQNDGSHHYGPTGTPPPAVFLRTIVRLTEIVIAECAPVELPVLQVTSNAFDEEPAVRRRVTRAVLGASRRQTATAFDAELGPLTLQLTLVVLTGVTTGAIEPDGAEPRGRLAEWWWRRRLVARLLSRPHAGADAVVPALPIDRARAIARVGHRLAGRAGLSAAEADRFAACLTTVLSTPQY
jgi:hypothetical protein